MNSLLFLFLFSYYKWTVCSFLTYHTTETEKLEAISTNVKFVSTRVLLLLAVQYGMPVRKEYAKLIRSSRERSLRAVKIIVAFLVVR